jgi:hypothetical protein
MSPWLKTTTAVGIGQPAGAEREEAGSIVEVLLPGVAAEDGERRFIERAFI